MKLWIDDIRIPPDNSWHICRSVGGAVRALDMYYLQVTEINLDHDISHQVILGKMSRPYACDETFESVARYIAILKKVSPQWNPTVNIQTSNPIGADTMMKIFTDAGIRSERKFVGGANRLEMNL